MTFARWPSEAWRITSIYSLVFRQIWPSPKRCSSSKAAHRSGYMILFQNLMHFVGRKAMAHSASAFRKKNKPLGTLKSKRNTIGEKTFHEEFLSFLKKHQLSYDPRFIWG